MCGIVGYTGKNNCLPILLEGLKMLEYRGYDSAGIAFIEKNKLRALKACGKLSNLEARMQALVALCGFKYERILGMEFYRKTDKYVDYDRYRVETGETVRKNEKDYTPYEIISVVRGALEDKVALYMEEIQTIVASVFRLVKPTDSFAAYVNDCVTLGEEKGLFLRSVSDRISLA